MRYHALGVFIALAMGGPLCAIEPNEPAKNSVQAPIFERFKPADAQTKPATDEIPDFQKHVSPLLGRLGCNGRACHGSFQGQGGFQLSLFGYDFGADYKALLEADRVDLEDKHESLILTKPVDADMHDGGKRYEEGQWQYWVLRSWIEAGAPFKEKQVHKLDRLEVLPKEVSFTAKGEKVPLRAIAHWADGTSEDVTCLCRFKTNDSAVAAIDEKGVVTAGLAGDTHVVVSYDNAVVPVVALQPINPEWVSNYPKVAASTEIDRLVIEKLRKLGITPSELCTDEEFIRRTSLDVTGTLPSADEIKEFVADNSEDKRPRKIEELLTRPGYAARWTTFLCDITGNNEDQLRNFLPRPANMSNQWYQWIFQRLEENMPYDQIVEGIVTATSRIPGESYTDYCASMSDICRDTSGEAYAERPGLVHYWARRNFQSAEERAIGFAYSFLGVRIQCAQCHKHPFDQWSKNDFDNFEKLFGNVQARQNTMAPDAKKEYAALVEELGLDKKLKGNQLRRELTPMLQDGKVVPLPELIVAKPRAPRNKSKTKGAQPEQKAKLLGSDWVTMSEEDIRGEIMTWLRSKENPYFAKAIVNRVWAEYLGVGIVNPPDDLNLANAPSNGPLLQYLADGFVDNGYDFKWLHREILNSDTYQRSWIPNSTNESDKHNFSHSILRRLSAEATYDALRTALADDDYSRKVRNLEVDRAMTKSGASARSNGSAEAYALSVFGRSIRESNCDCDRSSEPSLLQTVFLNNDSAVQGWLRDSKTGWVASVADKYGWKKNSNNAARQKMQDEALKRWAMQIEKLDDRLEIAKDQERTQTIKAIKKQRSQSIKRMQASARKMGLEGDILELLGKESGPQKDSPRSDGRMTEEEAMWVAENAYLRTLSRKPKANELQRVVSYLRDDAKPAEAVEGLMWSLINTKEFILNH